MQMNDVIIKDSFDLNEDNEGSYTNKNSIKNKNLERTANKKKMRRSRIIISENNDNSMDFRREVYDPETKYLKSIISAKNYNDYLTETRSTISKHFLKRKVKAAFEREPLEKNKSFFNIPFLPNANMFAAPPQVQPTPNMPGPQPGQMRPPANNPNQHQQNVKPEMRNISMNRPSDSNIGNSLTITNNAKLSQIAAHNKLHENVIGNLSQKPSLNSILNTTGSINSAYQNLLAQPTMQKITSSSNITLNTITNQEENLNATLNNLSSNNKNSNLGLANITAKTQSLPVSINLNASLEAQNKSTTAKIPMSANGTSQINIPNPNNINVVKQIPGSKSSPAIKTEMPSKPQENNLINYTSQIPISSSINAPANNANASLLPQRSLSGKFNIISGANSATQSSSNLNSIAIPSNALSSSNLNLVSKSAVSGEVIVRPKNEEFVSYDTESNDSSPRSNAQVNIINNNNNNNAVNYTKNLNVNANLNNFSVAYSASQGKIISDVNTNNINNANSSLSGQAKSLKVSFPLGGVMDEKVSTTAFSQQEISMQNASMMSSMSKQNTIFSKSLTGTSNALNANNTAAPAALQESSSSIANPNIQIDNISDILNDNDRLREKLLKQIVDIYKNNPDKLLNDLGPTDFAKIQNVINSAPKTGSAGQNTVGSNIPSDALKSSAASITPQNPTSNATSTPTQMTSKLSNQKISFPSSTLREDQMLFASSGSSSQNLTMQGISANSKKISFDLKNQTSLTLGTNSSSAANSANVNNALKSSVNAGSMPFMNFSGAAGNGNKIMIGNSAAANDSSIHKQLNYQILKTISNKNNSSGAANILSPNSNSNNLSNGASLYSNLHVFKGHNTLTGNSSSSANMSNMFLNTISQKINPKSSDIESSSNPSHSFKEESNYVQIPIVQESLVDEVNFEENQLNNSNVVKESENTN